MVWLLVVVLIFALGVASFAAQNGQTVDVTFLFWTVQTTVAVVILGAALGGAIVASLFGLATTIRSRLRLRRAEVQARNARVAAEAAAAQTVDAVDAQSVRPETSTTGGASGVDASVAEAVSKSDEEKLRELDVTTPLSEVPGSEPGPEPDSNPDSGRERGTGRF